MTTLYFLCFFVGGISGTIATSKIIKHNTQKNTPQSPVIVQPPSESEIDKKLTNLDLLEIPCSQDYIATFGDGLCREMFCTMFTRGDSSQTSGQQCEQIANVNNTISMLKYCDVDLPENSNDDSYKTLEQQMETCLQVFRERK
jgi:hypothetical protein